MDRTWRRAHSVTKTSIAGFAVCALVVAGCSDDKTNTNSASEKAFKSAAEQAIRDDVDATIAGDATAECDDPSSTEIGSTFSCVATASDGSTYFYAAKIITEKEVTVNFVAVGELATDNTDTADTTDTAGS